MDYILGWMIKIIAIIIPLALIIKITLISLNKDKMKAFEDTLSKNKSTVIIWFFPAMFSLVAVAMAVGMYSDELIDNGSTAQIKESDNASALDDVEQRLTCSLPFTKDKCD